MSDPPSFLDQGPNSPGLSARDGDPGLGIKPLCPVAPRAFFRQDSVLNRVAKITVHFASPIKTDAPVREVQLLTQVERRQIIESCNAMQAPVSQGKLIHELFEEQVEKNPDAIAVSYEDCSVSYAGLNDRSNRLAQQLRSVGVGPDQRVALCVQRSLEMVVGLFGILKAGGAYVPLDPTYPTKRLRYMLRDSAPRVVLSHGTARGVLEEAAAGLWQPLVIIDLDADTDAWTARPADRLDSSELGLTSQHLAYIIYTSGSTGNPKGVMVSHANLVASTLTRGHFYGDPGRFLLLSSIGFDSSVAGIFGTLVSAGRLLITSQDAIQDPAELARTIRQLQATSLLCLPGLYRALIGSAGAEIHDSPLARVVVAGEACPPTLISESALRTPRVVIFNEYGPTEATVWATVFRCNSPVEGESVPIGRPIANTRIYLLDGQCQLVPVGMPGEIFIGGTGVARGYMNRPELTAERFQANPFVAGDRLYRTGDLARYRPDGNIEFLGRNDFQVKIRGFRIELGEIEAQLLRHAQVKDAVVIAREDVPGEKGLVAYVTARDPSGGVLHAQELRAHLTPVLPQYMVPKAFVVLDRLPVSPNGKLDRRGLPMPQFGAYARAQYEPPQGEVEEILATLWQELLQVERVGRRDNFFELGGHSLLIVQLMERLRRMGLSTEVRRVFDSRSLSELASTLARKIVAEFTVPPSLIPAGCEAITPQMLPLVALGSEHIERIVQSVPGGAANIQDIYPLTPLQEGLLFHHLLDEEVGDTYVLPTVFSVASRGRLEELIAALQAVVDRHDVLRTGVLWEQLPQPVQVVHRRATLPVEEILLDRDPAVLIQEWMKPERQRLDLRQAPLMRLQVAADSRGADCYALLQLHHLFDDATSLKIVISEVVAHLQGRARQLPAPVPYRTHVAQALSYARAHDAESFFRGKLQDVVEPTAPFGLLDVHADGSRIEEWRQDFEPALAQRVRAQARHLGVSAATLFHAGWALVVGRTSGRDDVVFGTVLLGRLQGSAGAQRIMGMFINTLPLRLMLRGVTAKELVEQTQRALVELLSHEQASLVKAQNCSGIVGSAPLFTALLNYRHSAPNPEADFDSVSGIRVLAGQARTNYPITLCVDDLGEGFTLTAQTDRRIDPRRMAGYLHSAMQSLVETLERAPQTPVLALSILPQSERQQVIELFNTTQPAYPREQLIHQLFEVQVVRTPDAVAVVYEGQCLTYAELNGRANQLARHLRDKGVSPDELVGICVARSLQMVEGVLGVLKSGGAYVPLDPRYPRERLAHMLTDAAPRIVLTQASLRERLPQTVAEVITLDEQWDEIAREPADNLDARLSGLSPYHLAYVIYTSGSTGRPKGVMVEHRNVTRLFAATDRWFGFNQQDVWTLFHSFAFDFSVWELWGALSYGGRVVVVPELTARSPQEFYRLLCAAGVTVLNQTPSAFAQLIDARTQCPRAEHALRVVIFGGEALEPGMLRPWIKSHGTVQPRLVNMYGITETTVHVTYRPLTGKDVDSGRGSPIGKPIPDLQAYLLDSDRQPVPIGVVGEIYVGGAGVARGYLNQPELTAERFIQDPFSTDPRARLYKTGDLGRWGADGSIDYLGRNDRQVKIRGFRIELGEIEAELRRHSEVKDAVVLVREGARHASHGGGREAGPWPAGERAARAQPDEPSEKRLVAYVVGNRNTAVEATAGRVSEELRSKIVGGWKALYEKTYAEESQAVGPSFVGWNSSYTGQPIPEAQMQEWLTSTIARINALHPGRMLEIGCGVGLLLQHLAPRCKQYVGTDVSEAALTQLRQWMKGRENLQHVELLHRSALQLQDVPSGSFDMVVLNSVVQYFPDVEYLLAVLQEVTRVLTPGGRIFLGDVRHLGSLSMFHSMVQLGKAAATVSIGQLKRRIARVIAQEKELVIDPEFFRALPGRLAGIRAAEVLLKRGRALNELTRHRYDVVLLVGEEVRADVVCERVEWQSVGSFAALEAGLRERRWYAVHLRSIPNGRLAKEAAAEKWLETSDECLQSGVLRRRLNEAVFDGINPELFFELGCAHGYEVTVLPGEGMHFEVRMLSRDRLDLLPRVSTPRAAAKAWRTYTNDPLEHSFSQQLLPKLREYLKGRLPEHMTPSAWVALRQLPLTANGKLDRHALPAPDSRPEELGEYIAPRTDLERTLADIWAQVLRIDQVGAHDNFFELGGHSLLIVQMMERLRGIGLSAPLRSVYESPTLADLARALTAGKTEHVAVPANLIPPGCSAITPEMLPLVELDEEQIEQIVRSVPGGAQNIQDIYPLVPLQEGILFHHLLGGHGADVYIRPILLSVPSREKLDALCAGVQAVIDRHDMLRTALLWERLPRPVQVVYRQASLPIEAVTLQRDRDPLEQLEERMDPGRQELDLRRAPLIRLQISADTRSERWYALLLTHHLVFDNQSLQLMLSEVMAYTGGRAQGLPEPAAYRNYVAQALAYGRKLDAEGFFRKKLGEIDEPTAPFGLLDVHTAGSRVEEARHALSPSQAGRVKSQARRLGVSVAALFHAAWALVISRTSGRPDVVFGTVLLGRQQGNAGAQRILGMFINTLPLRLKLEGVTAGGLIEQTQRELVELLEHEQASLAVAQRCSSIAGAVPLFSALMNYLHDTTVSGAGQQDGESAVEVIATRGMTNYPFALTVYEQHEEFVLHMETQQPIDPRRMVGYVATAMQSLVVALEEAPRTPALELAVLPESERHQVIEAFNATRAPYPQRPIHQLFEKQVERTPDAVAALYAGHSLTYAELDRRAGRLAGYLVKQGVRPGECVPIVMPRCLRMLVAQLAVLKCGGAYVPIDPKQPLERQAFMIADCGASCMLADRDIPWEPRQKPVRRINCAAILDSLADCPDDSPGSRATTPSSAGAMPAYVMYTSGSSGAPKGVMVPHRAVGRLVINNAYARIEPGDRVAHCSNPAFDASTFEIWGALLNGASVVIVPEAIVMDPGRFAAVLKQELVTVLWLTVGLFTQYTEALASVWSQLRYLLTGGDVVEPEPVRRVMRHGAPRHLLNGYGPTECTTFASTYLIEAVAENTRSLPIGRPIANTQIYILNGHQQPTPVGVAGEIYIGGAGVACGYLSRPQLTAEKFIADPFSAGERLYKTGDSGRWRPDGTIEYLGRDDQQVKLRGLRIELGEIEAQLERHAGVKQAAVVVREDVSGDKRLVAYVIPKDLSGAPATLNVEGLRSHLKSVLPDYMVPSAFVVLNHLPLTANGKLDRRALPAPELDAYASREYEAPRGEVEEILAGIWQSLLRVERVGRYDNFFELGGHSLLIVQMMERLRRVGLSAEVRRVFESSTLADLASELIPEALGQWAVPPNRIPPGCETITPAMLPLVELEKEHIEQIVRAVPGGAANIQDIYLLAPLQEGILFHHLLNQQGADAYARVMLFTVPSREKLERFIEALQKVIDRHDILRTAVLWERLPRPVQVVCRRVSLPVEQFTLTEGRDPGEALDERMRAQWQRLDLRQAPLMRLQTAAAPRSAQWYVLLQTHHLVCDNASLDILLSEIMAHLEGHEQSLPESLPYRNHVAQTLAHARTHDAEAFFRGKLAEVAEPTAPFGLLDVHGDGSHVAAACQTLEPELSKKIRIHARRLNVSVATVFHAAWALVVARTSGRNDVVFGSVLLGRLQGSAGAQRILGMFINTLPLRIRLQGVTAKGLVEQTQRELVELLGHEQASLAVAQRCSGVAGSAPLFTALLNYRHRVSDREAGWTGETGVALVTGLGRTNYPVTLSVDDTSEGFALEMETDCRIDPRRMVGYVAMALQSFMEALERQPQTPALSLSILPPSERQQVIEQFNATQAAYPKGRLIHELFEEQVRHTPDAVAVEYEGQSLTYGELNRKANQLARYLVNAGVGTDEIVAICLERSVEMVVGLLGILKAGGAYLPLDPRYPADRLAFMLNDVAPAVLLTQEHLRSQVSGTGGAVIVLDTDWCEIARHSCDNLGCRSPGPGSPLAYVIYTSGSTGRPKGVMVEHAGVVNFLYSMQQCLGVGTADCMLAVATVSFDIAVLEIYLPLLQGAKIVVASSAAAHDPRQLIGMMEESSVTIMQATPVTWRMLLGAGWQGRSSLTALCGAEPLSTELAGKLASRTRSLWNLYGPTETTVWASSGQTTASAPELGLMESIGNPLANTQIYILNSQLQPVPIGVAGEIFIGGAGVSRGYLNRQELTVERFLCNPFGPEPQGRMYRTGDLGCWRADGTIECLGRNDHQVKIRGYRVEPGEIEFQLLSHREVQEAVVVAREDVSGEKRLVAYLTAAGAQAPLVEGLREHLNSLLPEYMVPSAFVLLEALPLTPSGKLDRRSLPAPGLEDYVSRRYEAPQGDVEEILAGVWQELLRVARVGRWDNFFELGGHSLLIVQLMERLRRVGLSAQLRLIFESPTLADMAGALRRGTSEQLEVTPNRIPVGCEAITPQMLPLVELDAGHIERIVRSVAGGAANIQDIYPLAPLQEGILFHHLLHNRGDAYLLSTVLSVSSRERLNDFVTALQAVIARHDVLRTAVLWEQLPRPAQVVYRRVSLPVGEIALDPNRDSMEQIQGWMKPERQRLDLRQAPLLRLQVARDPHGTGWYVLLQLHHLVGDATSLGLMISEVVANLEGHGEGLPPPMPYRNHVAQVLAYARTQNAEIFFRDKLGTIEEPTAPFGLLEVHGDGSGIEEAREKLDLALARRLRAQARRLGVSAATLFHAASGLAIACTTGRDDVVFGTVLLGRLQGSAGAQRVLGMFINTLPLRLRLRDVTASELMEQTQRELVELLNHEQASLAVASRCSGIAGSSPLFSALLNYRHHVPDSEAQWDTETGVKMLTVQQWTNYPITLSVDDLGAGFALTAQTDRRIEARRVLGYLSTAVASLVRALEYAPQTPALALSTLPDSERQQVLESFNATQVAYPEGKLIHELFEEQVRRTPRAVAVVYEGQSLTYAELNGRANQLARYLREKGVAADQLVGLCIERSLEMVVGLLGTLKAGGAYVPLDPNYPPARLAYTLKDAAPKVLLVQERLREKLPRTAAEVIALDRDWSVIAQQSVTNLDLQALGLRSNHLAYVIYTSGSTGNPKGAMNEHRGVVNRLQWMQQQYELGPEDGVLQKTSFGFDVSVWEFFWTLTNGARLIVARSEGHKDPSYLRSLIDAEGVTTLHFVPSMLQIFLDHHPAGFCSSVRHVVCSGEELPAAVQRKCFECFPQVRLSNLYGPTEAAVDVTAWECDRQDVSARIPIGRPLANIRMYVLDGRGQPVPIGVTGELYIGGVGVGRGYLGRPDLTAERFVPDPYNEEPEARMYRTGDLGRWRSDGTIDFLGRNDRQVKIRGFRIELAEIEAQLLRHGEVKEAVVMAREVTPGEKRLVAYVVGRAGGRSAQRLHAQLRSYLQEVLPDHMVPGAVVMLESLPLTPNGKLDRRALPAPDGTSYSRSRYEAPQGEVEEILARIWQELLRVDGIGRHDNFFELGGHSLLALQMMSRVKASLSVEPPIKALFESPTLAQLAGRMAELGGAEVDDPLIDLSQESGLDPQITASLLTRPAVSRAILLTGATGFVGRFLLAQLLEDTDAVVYCLLRAASPQQASLRLKATLLKWDLWREEWAQRLVAVPGDLCRPGMGLDGPTYQMFADTIDTIYHCGASVNHLETYTMARAANVGAASELLRLAVRGRLKRVNYISTCTVFSERTGDSPRVVYEHSPIDQEQHRNSQGYAASKWVGEKIFLTAGERGIPCNVFRLGLIWADLLQGRYDERQYGYRLIKSCLLAGYGISDYSFAMPLTPVDYAARAVVSLANRHSEGAGVFHISASGQMREVFECCNDILDVPLRLVAMYDWVQIVKRLHQAGNSLPIVPLLEFAFSMDAGAFHEHERRSQSARVRFDCTRTQHELEQAGVVLPAVDGNLLSRLLKNPVFGM